MHREGRALDKANVGRSSGYSNWEGYRVPLALSQEQTSWPQGTLHTRPQLVRLLQSPGSFSAAQASCGRLGLGAAAPWAVGEQGSRWGGGGLTPQ